jgi:hypothetical protein
MSFVSGMNFYVADRIANLGATFLSSIASGSSPVMTPG